MRTTTAVLAADGSGVTLLDGEFCYAGGIGVLTDAAAAEQFLTTAGWTILTPWAATYLGGRPAMATVTRTTVPAARS